MSGEDFVYRALLKERSPTGKSFRLRPNEEFLSIARTPEKAMGSLDCKGCAKMSVARILAIEGLVIREKTAGQTDPPDLDLLEIVGVPSFNDPDQGRVQDYADSLAATVIDYAPPAQWRKPET